MITGIHAENKIFIDGHEIDLKKSLKVVNHSPTGFQWGYQGSGPSQSALALLLEFGASKEEAVAWYQEFKRDKISTLPQEDFEMEDSVVEDWLGARRIFAREFESDNQGC